MTESSVQFAPVKDHDRVAYKAYAAIWKNGGKHVMLAAPTLEKLAEVWDHIVGTPLNRETSQAVVILKDGPA